MRQNGRTKARAARRLSLAALMKRSHAVSSLAIACWANDERGPFVTIAPNTTYDNIESITVDITWDMLLTADENAYVQIIQNLAQTVGRRLNWSLIAFRMVDAALYEARNEGAYWLLSGFSGQSRMACAKNALCMYKSTTRYPISYKTSAALEGNNVTH